MTGTELEKHFAARGSRLAPETLAKVIELCDAHRESVEQTRSNTNLKDEAIAAIVMGLEDVKLGELDALASEAVKASQRELDQEEGQIRRSFEPQALGAFETSADIEKRRFRILEQQAVLLRGRMVLDAIAATSDIAEIEDLVQEAVMHGDRQVATTAFTVALSRLRALTEGMPLEQRATDPRWRAAVHMEMRVDEYRTSHPSPVRRLRAIEAERQIRADLLRQDFDFAAGMMLGEAGLKKARQRAQLRAQREAGATA